MFTKQNNQNQKTNQPVQKDPRTARRLQTLLPTVAPKNLAPVALALTALIGTSAPAQAVNIKFDYAAGTSLEVRKGFEMAANIWEGLLADDTDIHIEVGMTNFADDFGSDYENVLGLALPEFWDVDFYAFENALAADATSADDATAVANLNISQDIQDDYEMILTQANAKALGLYDGSSTAYDGQIRINSGFNWDLDLTPGTGSTGADEFHYLSVALHEIAHTLGFTSGLDSNDWVTANSEGNATPDGETALDQVAALDMFRYDEFGNLNVAQVTDPDTQRFFSLDGTSNLAEFSTGVNGDGYQASHWKNDKWGVYDDNGNLIDVIVNDRIGIMDPAFGMGERGQVSGFDLTALDAIGWDLTGQGWDDLNMAALALQASSTANVSIFQDILEQFAAEQGLAWWWFRWYSGWWAVGEEDYSSLLADPSGDQLLSYAATVESFDLNSPLPAASVPEPGTTAALIGVGLLGLSSRRKRRQSKSSN
jgi:hypothetical protein